MVLFCVLHQEAIGLFPAWLRHYSHLGVDEFRLIFHGSDAEWSKFEKLAEGYPVRLLYNYERTFDESDKCNRLSESVLDCIGQWVWVVDSDEFVELPCRSVSRTVKLLEMMGGDCLFAPLLQRISQDGSLPDIRPGIDPDTLFPLASTQLCEEMGAYPARGKYPLFLVKTGSRIKIGNHYPQNGRATDELPLRGVSHHFKWHTLLKASMAVRSGLPNANADEIELYEAYLKTRRWHLPLQGSFVCERHHLFSLGLLRRPGHGSLRHAAWIGQQRDQRQTPSDSEPLTKLRVCIATWEILGESSCGGIGTSSVSLGELLASAGHEVTIVHVRMPWAEPASDFLVERYREKGLLLVGLDLQEEKAIVSQWALRSYLCWKWLRQQEPFDVIHFPDCFGLGAYTSAAKHVGLGFERTRLCVTLHGCNDWGREGNSNALELDYFDCGFLEKEACRLADSIISPSNYMLQWWQKQNRPLPENASVRPNVLRSSLRLKSRGSQAGHALREAVFFGRIEERKGVVLFCDALDELAHQRALPADFHVSFLGWRTSVNGKPSGDYLQERFKHWPFPWKILDNYNMFQALEHLMQPGCLAVIPSLIDNYPNTVLECVGAGIPFLSSRLPGILEMVHHQDHDRVLIASEPQALADAIFKAIHEGLEPARSELDFQEVDRQWLEWHEQQIPSTLEVQHIAETDRALLRDTTVCIISTEGGPHLSDTLAALRAQSVAGFETLLMLGGTGLELPEEIEADGLLHIERKPGYRQAQLANAAAQRAEGTRLLFLRENQIPVPGWIETMLRTAAKTGADVITCGAVVSSNAALESFPGEETLCLPIGAECGTAILQNNIGGNHFLVSRDLFLRLGGLNSSAVMEGHEHWHFFLKAMSEGLHLESIPEPLIRDRNGLPHPPRYPDALLEPLLKKWPNEIQNTLLIAHRAFVFRHVTALHQPFSNNEGEPLRPSPVICNELEWSGIQARYGRGWHDNEGHGRWSGKTGTGGCEIVFFNPGPSMTVEFSARVRFCQPGDSLTARLNGMTTEMNMERGLLCLHRLNLEPGLNSLIFNAALPPQAPSEADVRLLSVYFSEITLKPFGMPGKESVEWSAWYAQQDALPQKSPRCIASIDHGRLGYGVVFGKGWHNHELTHRWSGTDMEGAVVEIYSPYEKSRVAFTALIKPLRNGDQLTASLNGKEIAVISKPGHIRLEPLHLKEGLNTLLLSPHLAAKRPDDQDQRLLSYSFQEMAIEPVWPKHGHPPKTSYLICSTPRSGSTLLAVGLRISHAGLPREYLNPMAPDYWDLATRICQGSAAMDQFVEHVCENGIFAIKTHWLNFADFLTLLRKLYKEPRTPTIDLLKRHLPGLKFIHITRKDHLRQAISFAKALSTNVWAMPANNHDPANNQAAVFDARRIDELLEEIEQAEEFWKAFFAEQCITPLAITYEELDADYPGTIKRVLAFLGLPAADLSALLQRPLKRQSDSINEEWLRRYKEHIAGH